MLLVYFHRPSISYTHEFLFGRDRSFGNILVKIIVKVITAGPQSRQDYDHRLTGPNDLLTVEFEAFEFDGLFAALVILILSG